MSSTVATPAWRVPLSETTLGDEEAQAASDVVRSGWLTQGERVAAFERAFSEQLVGGAHAIAVANCTLGLEMAYQAVGVQPGDEVIVPALTFVATANAARRLGAVPVFADVRSESDLTVDAQDVARKVTSRTRAVCAVHYGGFAADVGALREVCRRAGAALVEDCAHAPGARWEGQPCGALGDVSAFSFFGNKNMTTGEGGMVCARDEAVATRLRLIRSHGMTTGTWDRHRGHAFTYDVAAVGTNARMDEIRAAVGLIQLRRLASGNVARARLVARYRELLAGVAGLGMPFGDRDPSLSAHHLFVVLLPHGADRAAVMTALRARGVQTSIHYPPTHRFTAYASSDARLPVTDAVAARILTLPLFPTMSDAQQDLVCASLREALSR